MVNGQDGYLQLQGGAQYLWPQYKPKAARQPDTGLLRYGTFHSLNTMRKQGRLLDLTILVEGTVREAHRLVLSSCSPFLEEWLQSSIPPGGQSDAL